MNFIVTIVYKKGNTFELVSGMIKASNAQEALGKAVSLKTKLGSIFLRSVRVCDEARSWSFEDSLIEGES
jgi:hypothetical protein